MRRFLCFLFFVLCSVSATAQTATPAQTLRLARATYEQGRLHEIPQQLNSDVLAKMNTQEKVEAYKILCLSYIYLEESEKADEAMLNILRTDPYFQINDEVDPAEFVALYRTFRTKAIYRIGAKLGVNFSQPNITNYLPVIELSEGSKYKFATGILFGGIFEMPFRKKLTLHGELLFFQKKFNLNLVNNRGENEAGESVRNSFEGTESQNWISLPVTLEYELFNKSFKPYIGGGVSFDYLLSSDITALRIREEAASVQETKFDFTPQRNKFNISTVLVAGSKFPIGGGFIVTEVRFIYGLTQVNSKESAFKNQRLALDYGYSDPVYKINTVTANVSYIYNVFKPKKLNRKRK